MSRTLSFLIFFLFLTVAVQAQGFFKTFSLPDKSEWVLDADSVAGGGTALLCSERVLILDNAGNIVREWPLGGGWDKSWQRIAIAPSGKVYVLVETNQNNEMIPQIHIYSAGGQFERMVEIPMTMTSGPYDIHFSGDQLYLSYVTYPEEKPRRIVVHRLSQDGTEIWRKEMAEGMLGYYAVRADGTGGIEASYISPGTRMLKLVHFDEDGGETVKEFLQLFMEGEMGIPTAFCRTPDGGYLLAGTESTFLENADLLLLKVGADGKKQWLKQYDIRNSDLLTGMEYHDGGYSLLSNSGSMDEGWQLNYQQDVVLTRIGLNGELQWKRAFGSVNGMEAATRLMTNRDHVFVSGYMIPYNEDRYKGFLIKTDKDGQYPQTVFPHALQTQDKWKEVALPFETKTQEIVSSCALPDGGIVAVMQVVGNTERTWNACAYRLDENGQQVWRLPLSDFASRARALKASPDGSFVAILEEEDWGIIVPNIIRFSADGKLIWKKQLWESRLNDLVVLPDGTIMVTGFDLLEQGIGFQTMLVKLDAQGNPLVRRIFPLWQLWSMGNTLSLTSDQRVLLGGMTQKPFEQEKKFLMMKLDFDGNDTWTKTYTGPEPSSSASFVIEKGDHYYIGGYTEPLPTTNRDIWLVKTDKAGTKVWDHRYDFDKMDEANFIIPVGEKSFCLAGTTGEPALGRMERYGFLAEIRDDGQLGQRLFYGQEGAQTWITGLIQGVNNTALFTANKMLPYGNAIPMLGKYDPGVVLSSDDTELAKLVMVGPVPAKNAAWLRMDHPYIGNIRILITGINGVVLRQLESRKSGHRLDIALPVQGLPGGVYQVEIKLDKVRVVKRLIIQP
ncbi:MAG: hypothetical protein ACTHMC_19895 [Pseudobacter sp.]|uniref:hypothetical protein n=1 Tax=Pseudobacter sp. TaxID=2045420 RepID=UPI003F7D2C43